MKTSATHRRIEDIVDDSKHRYGSSSSTVASLEKLLQQKIIDPESIKSVIADVSDRYGAASITATDLQEVHDELTGAIESDEAILEQIKQLF